MNLETKLNRDSAIDFAEGINNLLQNIKADYANWKGVRATPDRVDDFGKNLKKLLVITRGDKGAISIFGDQVDENKILSNLEIKDLTGAGDLFAAGFLHGYLNNLSNLESLNKGREMSSKVIQQIGARL